MRSPIIRSAVEVYEKAAGSLYRRSGRYRYYRRHAVLSDCRSADGQSDGSFIHLCCTISDQYCWRHDHGHRDHNDNEENKGAGKVSAADQQLTGNIAGHSYRCCAWGQCIGAGCLALYICGGRYIDDTCVGGENTGYLIVAVV